MDPRIEHLTKYPIAELFDSLQGEGTYTGTRMYFIRMAGCNVGKPIKPPATGQTDMTPSPYERCTLYDGRTFVCDTNYQRKSLMTIAELVNLVPVAVNHVSITGGEPFLHNLSPLIEALVFRDKMVHIETSGTLKPDWLFNLKKALEDMLWITCSPKMGAREDVVDMADELKILVDKDFDFTKIPDFIREHENVFLSPVNGLKILNRDNQQIAVDVIMNLAPTWKLTTQSHKIWGLQ